MCLSGLSNIRQMKRYWALYKVSDTFVVTIASALSYSYNIK